MTLRDKLKDCWVSKESLKEQLCMMEKNILIIVDQYEGKARSGYYTWACFEK